MNPRRKPKNKYYDVIIIGAGIGGLTTGALLAYTGKKVLLLEYHPDRVGGYAQSFRRKSFVFDSSIHAVGGCKSDVEIERGGLIGHVFDFLGISSECNFIKLDPFYSVILPNKAPLTIPLGVENFIDAYIDAFPEEALSIEKFVYLCQRMSLQINNLPPKIKIGNMFRTVNNSRDLLRYAFSTLGQVMNKFFKSDILKSSISALWPYLVVPPGQMSFPYWCGMLMSYIEEGAYYCEGSFSKSADALLKSIRDNGGEILFGTKADEILVKDEKVYGVKLANMNIVYSDIVVSNADVEQTFGKLVPLNKCRPELINAIELLKKSISAFTVYLGVNQKPPLGYETLFYTGVDHDQNYSRLLKGDISGLAITCPTVIDPSCAPKDHHIVVLTTFIPFDLAPDWSEDVKKEYANKMIKLAEQVIPELSQQIVILEIASPMTFAEYTLNTDGSVIGIANTRKYLIRPDFAKKSRIENLYLVGQDGVAGGGFYGVFISGVETVKKILGTPSTKKLLKLK